MTKSGELPWPCYWGITLAPGALKWGYTMALDNTIVACQFGDGLLVPQGFEYHLRLECSVVPLPMIRHSFLSSFLRYSTSARERLSTLGDCPGFGGKLNKTSFFQYIATVFKKNEI